MKKFIVVVAMLAFGTVALAEGETHETAPEGTNPPAAAEHHDTTTMKKDMAKKKAGKKMKKEEEKKHDGM